MQLFKQSSIKSILALTIGSCLFSILWAPMVHANKHQISKYKVTDQQSKQAKQAQYGVPLSFLKKNAPSQYDVKSGDTLWQISSIFLKSSKHWPLLWGANASQIKNPHLIFPKQRLYLIRKNGKAYLSNKPDTLAMVNLKPNLSNASTQENYQTISPLLLQRFAKNNRLIAIDSIEQLPRIIAGHDQKTLFANGERIFVQLPNTANSGSVALNAYMQIFQLPIQPEKNTRLTTLLGDEKSVDIEANYVGEARLIKQHENNIYEYEIDSAKQEVKLGDVILPKLNIPLFNLEKFITPQASATIIRTLNNSENAAKDDIILINKGEQHGLKMGHMLGIYQPGNAVNNANFYNQTKADALITLPTRLIGQAVVFQTGKQQSYAYINQSNETINKQSILKALED